MTAFAGETSVLSRSDGSASVQFGDTKVVVSVTGPIEPKVSQELPTTAALEIIVNPDTGVSNTRETLLEDKLRSVLQQLVIGHLYPRQLIQVTCQVLEAGEAKEYTAKELSAVINAAYLALIDADIALSCSLASVNVSIDSQDNVLLNPGKSDLKACKSHHVFVYKVKNSEATNLLFSDSIGDFSKQEFLNLIVKSKQESQFLYQQLRSLIESKVAKDFIWQ